MSLRRLLSTSADRHTEGLVIRVFRDRLTARARIIEDSRDLAVTREVVPVNRLTRLQLSRRYRFLGLEVRLQSICVHKRRWCIRRQGRRRVQSRTIMACIRRPLERRRPRDRECRRQISCLERWREEGFGRERKWTRWERLGGTNLVPRSDGDADWLRRVGMEGHSNMQGNRVKRYDTRLVLDVVAFRAPDFSRMEDEAMTVCRTVVGGYR